MLHSRSTLRASLVLAALLLALAAGCGRHANYATSPGSNSIGAAGHNTAAAAQNAQYPAPAGRVPMSFGGHDVSLWPWTDGLLDGVASDPVNLVFYGKADPVAIRDALLSLDGNRAALGLPPVPPFNARWSDAMGDVQATYVDGEGWIGSVIQLTLGDFAPMRVHLRLFQVRSPVGDGELWTLGAAHFEVLIPGTANHWPLSWELAEQIVAGDLQRSGLLAADNPVSQTGLINDAPGFRAIPTYLYNELPDELIALIGGPPKPVTADVPIKTDGHATVLHLAGRAPAAGARQQHFTVNFDQTIPRPWCSSGPYDYVHVSGPLVYDGLASVDAAGTYSFQANYKGKLTAVPIDVTQQPPAPAGEPFSAQIGEEQRGWVNLAGSMVSSDARQIVPGKGGSEFVHTFLRVASDGSLRSDVDTRCR